MKVLAKAEGQDLERLMYAELVNFSDDDVYMVQVVEYEDTGKIYLEVEFDQEGALRGGGYVQIKLAPAMVEMFVNMISNVEG